MPLLIVILLKWSIATNLIRVFITISCLLMSGLWLEFFHNKWQAWGSQSSWEIFLSDGEHRKEEKRGQMGEEKTGSVDRQTGIVPLVVLSFCFGCEQQSSYEKDWERIILTSSVSLSLSPSPLSCFLSQRWPLLCSCSWACLIWTRSGIHLTLTQTHTHH